MQLGLITRINGSNTSIMPTPERTPSPPPCLLLPFIDIDNRSNPWVDGAPPNHLIRGRKRSDPIKTLRVTSNATYAGWVSLREPLSRVVIYGNMDGIRVSYSAKDRSDSYFGNTSCSLSRETRVFHKPRRPIRAIAQHRRISEKFCDDYLPNIKVCPHVFPMFPWASNS